MKLIESIKLISSLKMFGFYITSVTHFNNFKCCSFFLPHLIIMMRTPNFLSSKLYFISIKSTSRATSNLINFPYFLNSFRQ